MPRTPFSAQISTLEPLVLMSATGFDSDESPLELAAEGQADGGDLVTVAAFEAEVDSGLALSDLPDSIASQAVVSDDSSTELIINTAPEIFNAPEGIQTVEAGRLQYEVQLGAADINAQTLEFREVSDSHNRFTVLNNGLVILTPFENMIVDENGDNIIYSVVVEVSDGIDTDQVEIMVDVIPAEREFQRPIVTPIDTSVVEGSSLNVPLEIVSPDFSRLTIITPQQDGLPFEYDPTTQTLISSQPFDFENPEDADSDNIYSTIMLGNEFGLFPFASGLTVEVTDVDESGDNAAPEFVDLPQDNLFDVPRFNTIYGTVRATDSDGDAVFYRAAPGQGATGLRVDSVTGEITGPEAFSSLGDDGLLNYTVQAVDGINVTEQTLTFQIADIDESANQVPVLGDIADFSSVPFGESVIGNLAASDADGQQVRFFVGGPDANHVYIRDNQQLVFVDPSRTEQTDITIFASDRLSVISQDLTINRVDGPVEPPTGPNESPIVKLDQHPVVPENTTFVVDVDATDPDGDELTYSISLDPDSGERILDGGLFEIDSKTGVLEFKEAPDYEADRNLTGTDQSLDLTYTVFVDVSDGTDTVTREVWLTVADVPEENESAPRLINLPDGILEIEEGRSFVYQLGAFDADGDTLLFRQAPTSTATPLTVSPDGQILALNDSIQAEDSYTLLVEVTDGTRTDDAEIVVNIVAPPTIGVGPGFPSVETTVSENEQLQYDVSSYADAGPVTLSVAQTDGQTLDDGQDPLFVYNPITKQIESTRALDFENPEDSGGNNTYDIVLISGSPFSTLAPQPVLGLTVTVTDADESTTAPEFTDLPAGGAVSLVERNSQVIDLNATDADGQAVYYELVGEESNRLFQIDPVHGQVAWKQPDSAPGFPTVPRGPEFESNGPNQYELTVRATDGVDFTDTTLTVNVTDVNEASNQAPVFGDLTDFRSVPRGEAIIGTLNATDAEGQEVRYFVSGRHADQVSIDPLTNELKFIDPNRISFTSFTVHATDGLAATSVDMGISRGDRPVEPPEPTNERPGFTNVRPGIDDGQTEVADFQIIDPDGDPLTITVEGPDADSFFLDDDLRLHLLEPADFADPQDANQDGFYELRIAASDEEFTETRDIRVEVLGDPPVVPPAGSGELGFTNLPDDGMILIPSFEQNVIQLQANSPTGASLEYSVIGGEENWLFGLDSATGELTLFDSIGSTSQVNDGLNNVLDVIVQVTDGTDVQTRALQIDFIAPPVVTPDGPIFANLVDGEVIHVQEGRARVREFTIGASLSEHRNSTVELVGGADADFFTLEPESGALIFTSPPDFESPADADGDNLYDLRIRATDIESGGVTEISFQVEVEDLADGSVNRPPSIPSLEGTNGRINVFTGTSQVTTFRGSDADSDNLTYSLISGVNPELGQFGEDNWHFFMDEQTGRLQFVDPVDFEVPRDTDGNNRYELVVRVFDGISFQDYSVTIVVNDEQPTDPTDPAGRPH